ncbi:hypothetical protein SteCoe_25505 [Stentor coeruleus]|uniref:Adenylate kinase active site lid domain-containing protein n=1 Tax=Stentor coeruleus TaxID=5963 RepID=A0A1R2BF25_9CILI|nr:hypothetical protein SteCoe_25505 [Stentor coeruleus]
MKKLLLIGAPCVGKTTFSNLLSIHYNLPLIYYKAKNPSLSSSRNKRGNPNRDSAYCNYFKQAILELPLDSGYIIAGFPRNIEQVMLMHIENLQYDLVIDLFQPENVVILKAKYREICIPCNTSYNSQEISIGEYQLKSLAPKAIGKCDHCEKDLVKRPDDEFSHIKRRYFDYIVNYEDLRKYFEKKDKYFIFNVTKGVEDFSRLVGEIESFYAKNKR